MGAMSVRLIQLRDADGQRRLAACDADGAARFVDGVESSYELAQCALSEGVALAAAANARLGAPVDLVAAEAEDRLLAPIDHPDAAHLILSGTGLTHLGSAEGRDKMHKAAAAGAATD